MTDYSTPDLVQSSTPAPGARLIRLNRPEKRNALSQPLIRSLLSALCDAEADPDIFSIILVGNGSFFCGEPQMGGGQRLVCSRKEAALTTGS